MFDKKGKITYMTYSTSSEKKEQKSFVQLFFKNACLAKYAYDVNKYYFTFLIWF